jgi:hypothetical protein
MRVTGFEFGGVGLPAVTGEFRRDVVDEREGGGLFRDVFDLDAFSFGSVLGRSAAI